VPVTGIDVLQSRLSNFLH